MPATPDIHTAPTLHGGVSIPSVLSQRVVWTLLPNGVRNGKLQLSILVSPRLTLASIVSPATLSQFPDWASWPGVINGATFTLSVDGGPPKPLHLAFKPEPKVWQAIFPSSTLVAPYQFTDLRGKAILSYPVAMIAKGIEALYGHLALTANDDLPSRRDLEPVMAVGRISHSRQAVMRALRDEAQRAAKGASIAQSEIRQPGAALSLLTTYHMPLSAEDTQSYSKEEITAGHQPATWLTAKHVALPKAADFQKRIDFHQIVASLAQYQELNRLAGLVVSVEIAPGQIPDGDHRLQLAVDWPKSGGAGVKTEADVIPPVMARKQGLTAFITAPRSPASPLAGRYLRLQGGGFDLVQVDVDGAALKLKNFATSLRRGRAASYDDDTFEHQGGEAKDPGDGAPSLRTGGLMLAQERRDMAIQQLFAKNGELQDSLDKAMPTLFAEDVVRGYRVDVHDGLSGKWRTLCSRTIDFGFVNDHSQDRSTKGEEGTIRLASASSADGANPDILKIHEGLFAWKGWSLCAPEPGQVLQPDDTTIAPENQSTPEGLPLTTRFTPTGQSLPSLRFGRTYKVRVRVVDLAGAAEDFSDADLQPAAAVSNAAVYRRYEPLEAPALALVKGEPPRDGESMGRIAIRSFNDDPSKNAIPIVDRGRRHVLPARVTHRFAEQHGVMDTPAGKVDPGLFAMLTKLDRPLEELKLPSVVPGPPPKTVETSFAVAPDHFELPYLPDPLAIGVAIKIEGADGIDPDVIHPVPLYGPVLDHAAKPNWPHALPFKLVVAETAPAEPWNGATREFVVGLKKGERARLRVSSLIRADGLPKMAASAMILAQNPTPAQLAAVSQRAAQGQHWMFTPWRTVELVHAVQKPLITPQFDKLAVRRDLGSIKATPDYQIGLHGKTTARIDLSAQWAEPLDDAAIPEAREHPVARSHRAHVYERKIARNDAPANKYLTPPGLDHVFGDTRYRRVAYTMDATTRHREFMPENIREHQGLLKVSSPPTRTWVPNAAPPPPPKLLYVVPTFGWARNANAGRSMSLRIGWGLRVYLDRPWFASGFGEMLGVVLPTINPPTNVSFAALPAADTTEKPFITQWGRDPIWTGGKFFTAAPPKAAFPLAVWRPPIPFDGTNLPAEEGSDLPPGDFKVDGLAYPGLDNGLSVAPHAVGFDPDRKLWYADIVIRPPDGSDYFPFVRLGLARYHPVSVDGAHLSNIVLAEFQQLTPWRFAVVTHPGPQSAHVAIYGIGVGPADGSPQAAGLFDAEAQVLDAGADPDLGWRAAEPQGPQHLSISQSPVRQSMAQLSHAPLAAAAQAEAQKHIALGDYQALLARPDLVSAVTPPLLWEGDVPLPSTPPGGRRRLVLTEREIFETSPEAPDPDLPSMPQLGGARRRRIVYLETIEV